MQRCLLFNVFLKLVAVAMFVFFAPGLAVVGSIAGSR